MIAPAEETNPFIAEFECTRCGATGKRVDEFPGPLCFDCYEDTFDPRWMTAEDLAKQFTDLIR